MKRSVITILAFLYLALASGVGVNIHYCMGKLSSVDYGYKKAGHCDKCGMKEKDGCCNTEFKVVKLQDSHQWSNQGEWVKNFSIHDLNPCVLSSISVRDCNTAYASVYYSPPDKRLNEIYLHISTLLI